MQLMFRRPKEANPFGSALLQTRHYHGKFDEWFVHQADDDELPNFVTNGVAALMAFKMSKRYPAPPIVKNDENLLISGTNLGVSNKIPQVAEGAFAPIHNQPANLTKDLLDERNKEQHI